MESESVKSYLKPCSMQKLDVFEEWVQKEKKGNILTNVLECEAFTELIKKRESTMFNTCLQSISTLLDTYD